MNATQDSVYGYIRAKNVMTKYKQNQCMFTSLIS